MAGRWVLVVDDEESVRFVCRIVLEQLGLEVAEAVDGQEALDWLEGGNTVDLVMTDLTMPRLGGAALRDALAERHPQLPVLLWSTVERPEVGAIRKDPMDPGLAARLRGLGLLGAS